MFFNNSVCFTLSLPKKKIQNEDRRNHFDKLKADKN